MTLFFNQFCLERLADSAACLMMMLACLIFSATSPSTATAASLELAPQTTFIVVANQPERREHNAAALLSTWLRAASASDKGFEIISEKDAATKNGSDTLLAVGSTQWSSADSRLASLKPDGFLITSQDNHVVIAGNTPDGTHYGVTHFLDRYAGVRFYIPGDAWTSLPTNTKLTYDGQETLSNPFVSSCYLSGINTDDAPAARWARTVGAWRRKGGTHQHNLFAMFPPKTYAQSHPEIYPIYEGKRYIPKNGRDQSWQLCFTQPALVDLAMESIRHLFAQRPNDLYATISNNDGGRWCTCDACTAIVNKHKALNPEDDYLLNATTEMYWSFMANVGEKMLKEFPDKLLVGLAYGPTRQPPAFKLPANVTAFTNFHIAELPVDHIITTDPANPELLDQWLSVSSHLGNHDWYQGSGYLIPRIYSGYWSQYLKAVQAKQEDALQHCEAYPNWYLDGPKFYILARLWWNPQLDPAAITRQFCDDMFGQAGSSMNDYYLTMEKLWVQLNIIDGPERKLMRWTTQFRTTDASRAMIAQGRAALDQAACEAQTEQQKFRISMINRSYEFAESLFDMQYYSPSSQEGEAAFVKAEALAPVLSEDRMANMHHQHAGNAVKELRWARLRTESKALRLPAIKTPTFNQPSSWEQAIKNEGFVIKGVGADTRGTFIQIGHDDKFIYLRAECPRNMSTLVETNDDSWRSDNLEIFIDNDGNPDTMERQFWVKTSGRVVNHTKNAEAVDNIKASVQKKSDRLIYEIILPLAYANITLPPAKPVTIQIFSNEFIPEKGVNVIKQSALWNRQIQFSLP